MNRKPGPVRVSPERAAAARTPPIVKSDLPAEHSRQHKSTVPLRRPAPPRRYLTEEPLAIDPVVVDQALEEARKGNTIGIHAEGSDLTLRIVPSVRDAVQQSGFSSEEMNRLFVRLAKAVGSEKAFAKLRLVDGTRGLRLYRTLIGRAGVATAFRFVLAWLPESSSVVVVACFPRRLRID